MGQVTSETAYTAWATATALALGAIRVPTKPNGRFYEVSVAGTTTAEPTWPSILSATVSEPPTASTVTWRCAGYYVSAWASSTQFAAGAMVFPLAARNGYWYTTTGGGTTGGAGASGSAGQGGQGGAGGSASSASGAGGGGGGGQGHGSSSNGNNGQGGPGGGGRVEFIYFV